jgi:hypothetical protein
MWIKSSYSAANGNCLEWKKSSYSSYNGNCIEVTDGVLVRDSKNPSGPVLHFGDEAWLIFINSIK